MIWFATYGFLLVVNSNARRRTAVFEIILLENVGVAMFNLHAEACAEAYVESSI
jgi:hypothetical protein